MPARTSVLTPRGTVEVAVMIHNVPQPLYNAHAPSRYYVAGTPGATYKLWVRNTIPGRVEVITTVDGRNTLKDEAGDYDKNRGLIVTDTATFTGWRVDDNTTREFTFGHPDRSVAAQATGSTSNTGVIGFAVYAERKPEVFHQHYAAPHGHYAAVASPGPQTRGSSLGTGIGERQRDPVHRTAFTRAPGGPEILVIGYDTVDALVERGIIPPAEPDAFPGTKSGTTGYEQYE